MVQLTKEELLAAKIPCEKTGITIKTGICGFCGGKCLLDVYCKDGKVIKVEGNHTLPGTNGRICVKGAAMQQALYNKNRLKYPMKRTGERGEGRFERITWDEAFSVIAEQLNVSKERYGAKSTLFYVGHPKWFRYQATELANAYGTPNFGTESSTCAYAITMANQCCFGQGVGFLMPDMARCKVLCAWGANVLHSNPITQGSGLLRMVEQGVKLIVVDPRCTPTSEMAEIHLRPIPGTDGALALGMARVIISEGLQSQEYIDRYTLGYAEYRDYVMKFTPQKVEEITGVPYQDMIKAARMLAGSAPFSLMTTASPLVHNINGVQNVRAIALLQAITGSYGMPGGCMAPGGPPRAILRDTFMGKRKQRVSPMEDVSHEEFPAWAKLCSHEAQVTRLAEYIEKQELHTVLAFGMNHHMWPRVDRLENALQRLDFFVNADIYMTDTCKYADIILPVQPSLEREQVDIIGPSTLYYQDHIVEPAGEAKADIDILIGIAEKLGLEIGEEMPIHSNEEYMRRILSSTGLTLEEVKAAPNGIKAKKTIPARTEEQIMHFKTPSGKIEFVSSVLESCQKVGHEGLPIYHDFREVLPMEEYPLILSTGSRKPQFFHSRTYRLPWLAHLEQYPMVEVHPSDAERINAKTGDLVRLSTPVGSMSFVLLEDISCLPGVVNLYHGAGQQDINYILDDNYLDPISGFPGYKSYCCRLEKQKEVDA